MTSIARGRQTEVDKEISKAMLRTDAADALASFLSRVSNAPPPTSPSATTSGALGGFLIPPDTAAYMLLQRRMKAFMGVEREALVLTHSNDRDFPVPQLDRVSEAGEKPG